MKYVAQTIAGMEDISIKEVSELIDAAAEKLQEGRITFDTTNHKAKELSTARSMLKVYELMQEIEFTTLEDLKNKVKQFDFKDPFAVRCQREGKHGFQSLDVEKEIGEVFYHTGHKVDLHKPETTIIADITDNKCLIGKDLTADKDLSKRQYRAKAHPKSINACLAYGAVRLSGWTQDKTLLNPYCKDGVIAIEAALTGGKNITATDTKPTNIKAAQTNAKLAGANINFTEQFEGTADYIITSLTRGSKIYEKAEQLLTDKGTLVIIAQQETEYIGKLKLQSKRQVKVHKTKYTIYKYRNS